MEESLEGPHFYFVLIFFESMVSLLSYCNSREQLPSWREPYHSLNVASFQPITATWRDKAHHHTSSVSLQLVQA